MLDSFGREIDYLRISITDRCNFRCVYCMPEEGIVKKEHSDILSFEDILRIVKALSKYGIKKVRVTGGEPMVRKGCLSFINQLGSILGINDVCLTTNGFYLKDAEQELKHTKIDMLNVSLDTLDKNTFAQITRGGDLDKVFQGLDVAINCGIKNIKINAVLMRGINDNAIREFAEFGKAHNFKIRFIEIMPFSVNNSYEKYGITADEIIAKYNLIRTPEKDYSNNIETYAFEDGLEVGFIRPISKKFCEKCNRLRLTADGKLLLCLHGSAYIDLKDVLDDENKLNEAIESAFKNKPREHNIDLGQIQKRDMNRIGG